MKNERLTGWRSSACCEARWQGLRYSTPRWASAKLHFFNCNRRHHTLALLPAPSPKRLHHFMVESASLDDVGRAIDRMERDSRILITFGRHTNDHMYSFYGITPSGFAVEFGCTPRDVDRSWSVVRYDSISMWGHKFIPPE